MCECHRNGGYYSLIANYHEIQKNTSCSYNYFMTYVYLSPHLDDVALSCGGLVWEQIQAGEKVEIWTVCAGDSPPEIFSPFAVELHQRWGVGRDAAAHRRNEDIRSCRVLGAGYRHFEIPDAIYRLHPDTGDILYGSQQAIFGGLHEGDEDLIHWLVTKFTGFLQPDTILVAPLTLGNHVDHQLTRILAEWLNLPLAFYADFPYVLDYEEVVNALVPSGFLPELYPVSEKGLNAWQASIAAHISQINTFWPDVGAMSKAVKEYHLKIGGLRLWMKNS